MTKERIDEFINNDLYRLAGAYVKSNPIIKYDYHDYVQELVLDIWTRINEEYDENKGALTTWCYQKFRAKRTALIRQRLGDDKIMSLDTLLDNDGLEFKELLSKKVNEINASLYYTELLSYCGPMTQEWLYGYSYSEIAVKFKCSKSKVASLISKDLETLRKLFGENE